MPMYWIEKTHVKGRPDREKGEYSLGHALWSPQKSKGGKDIYRFMREVRPGDIVLHLTDDTAFTGVSLVKSVFEDSIGPQGTESAQKPIYLVRLRNFKRLDPPLPRDIFFGAPYGEQLLTFLIGPDSKNLFYNRKLNLNQGAYLTPAPAKLVEILNDAYRRLAGKLMIEIPKQDQQIETNVVFKEVKEPGPAPLAPLLEKELLEHIQHYIEAKGYYFETETLYNYHICLKTRPFVILAGLSGTGKSKLPKLYAEALGHTFENDRYLRLPVRPTWNDDRYLLGYLNSITGEYMTEPAVDFVLRAGIDNNNLYFFCLDEMNLAHVEYYFSQFLSALEEDEPLHRNIRLLSEKTLERLTAHNITIDVPSSLLISPNLLITGTVNVDETTQPLSDKVMDRANTIEFFKVDLDKIPEPTALPNSLTVSARDWYSYQSHELDTSYRSTIIDITKILYKGNMGLGYRVLREIELYLANSKGLLSPEVALDLQVKQRILPRVRGTKEIEEVVNELLTFLRNHSMPRSTERLEEMIMRLERNDYVNFWR